MHRITLICTKHEGAGNCSSWALYKAINAVKPEVIFEELSQANFNKSYNEGKLITLETNAVKLYLLDHACKHIPVDTFELPNRYDELVDKMYNTISANNEVAECEAWRNLLKKLITTQDRYGFEFLNSDANDEIVEKLDNLEQIILGIINDEQLFEIRKMRMDVIERREEEMINNIYSYSKSNPFGQALFFIGAGHRRSIVKKIREASKHEVAKLEWEIL